MFIECGELRSELLILLIYNIGILFSKTLISIDKEDKKLNILYYLFIKFISHFLAVIPMLISKRRSQSTSNEDRDNVKQQLNAHFKKKKKEAIKKENFAT